MRRRCNAYNYSIFEVDKFSNFRLWAGVSRAGARTGLQLLGYGDIQRFNSSSLAQCLRSLSPPPFLWLDPRLRASLVAILPAAPCLFLGCHLYLFSADCVSGYYLARRPMSFSWLPPPAYPRCLWAPCPRWAGSESGRQGGTRSEGERGREGAEPG